MIKHVLFLSLLFMLTGCEKRAATSPGIPERIISLAPNITETIYALGLENKLVGTSSHCTYPAAAESVPSVGGFGQYNYEAIVSLNPDLVILQEEEESDQARLDGLGIAYLKTGSYFIADILNTIKTIGKACGAESQAAALIQKLNLRIDELTVHSEKAPRVLITFSGTPDATVEQVYAFGTACIHNELLELAGGKNVVEGKLPFATLSREAIMRLNPDIIIELAPGQKENPSPVDAWKQFPTVQAVKHNRVYQLTGDYTCIPGPRFTQTLEDFSTIIRGAHD